MSFGTHTKNLSHLQAINNNGHLSLPLLAHSEKPQLISANISMSRKSDVVSPVEHAEGMRGRNPQVAGHAGPTVSFSFAYAVVYRWPYVPVGLICIHYLVQLLSDSNFHHLLP